MAFTFVYYDAIGFLMNAAIEIGIVIAVHLFLYVSAVWSEYV